MNISINGIRLIEKWEGIRLRAYQDSVGVWTIGYGHTKNVHMADRCTQAQAEQWLKQDVVSHITGIKKYVKVPLNQNQFDALASFHFNLGSEILKGTDLLKFINSKQWAKAGNEMLAYCHAGGKRLQGLYNRRMDERNLFMKPIVIKTQPLSKK